MGTMKNILVASDLSIRAERAVRRAFDLASRHQAELTVLTVIDDAYPHDMVTQLAKSSETSLNQLCASISDHRHSIRAEIGDPHAVIHQTTEDVDADLIVLGTHRRRPLADITTRTTMERFVRRTHRPTLLVKNAVDHEYRHAVCGLDASPSSLAALESAAALAPEARIATYHAVHVPFGGFLAPGNTAEQVAPFLSEATNRIGKWLSDTKLPNNVTNPEMVIGGVIEALRNMLDKTPTDLIVVGAHGRPRFSPSYLGSFTESLLRFPPCDALVVRR